MADYTSVIQDLANVTWRRLAKDDIPGVNAREISRVFPRDSDADGDNIITFLDIYVDLKNHVAGTPHPYVDDPVMENVTYPGRWRLVSNGYNRAAGGYVQVLRLGWATAIDIAECQIQAGSDSRSDARSYTFLWRNIASSTVDSCVEGLRATNSFVNPVIQGEVKDGAFSISEITPAQQADGSYWITVNCLKVAAITAIGDLAALSPVRKDVHDIENPFGLEGGYTTHVGRKPTDGIVLTYRALASASRSVIMALTDAQLQTLVGVTDALKYEFVKRELGEDAGNTLTLTLVYQYIPLATTITAASARYVGMTRKNQSNKIIIEISWPRIDPTAIGTISENALYKRDTVTNPVVEGITYSGEYFVNTTEAPMTNNDGIRIIQKMTKAGDQKLDLIIGKDPDHLIYEFWRWDISALDIGEFMSETGGEAHADPQFTWGTPEIGTTKTVDITKQADESFILHAIYSDTDGLDRHEFAPVLTSDPDGISGTPLEVRDNYGKTTKNAFGWNIPIAYLRQYAAYFKPAAAVVNQRNKFTISRQTEHVFDFKGERETFVPTDSDWLVMDDDEFKKVSVLAGAYILKATLADGQIFGHPAVSTPNVKYVQSFKENDVGSFDGQMTKTEFREIDSGDIIIEDNNERTVTRRKGEYILAANITLNFSRPIDVPGTKVELDIKDTDVASFDAVKTTILTKDQKAAGGEVTLLDIVSVDEHTSGDTVAVPTAAQNVKVDVVEAPTRGGKLRTKKVTSTLQPWTSGAVVVADDRVTNVTQTILKNQTTAPTASSNEEVQLSDNDRGGFNAVKRTKALSASASGTFAMHSSSVIDWDISAKELRTPTWNTSTNSDVDAYITGYNNWRVSMSRSRTITTTITKSYTMTEPATLIAAAAVPGGSEGAGTSYFKDARKNGDVWELINKTVVTSAWGNWGYKTLTWINYIQTMVGTGS